MNGLNEFEQQVRQTQPGAFGFVHHSEMTIKKPDWLIKNFIEKDTLVQFFGDPSFGKTLTALDVACCCATGRDFHGLKVQQCGVLFISGEGMNGLTRRKLAWEIANNESLADAPLYFSKGPASFCDPESLKQVRAAIDALPEGVHVGLIIIDTLARNFGPGDENSTKDMTAFISALDVIRVDYRCAMLPVHHSGHGDKTRGRGAMALKGALDAEYLFTKDTDGLVRMTCTKMKDFEMPEPMAFRIKGVDLGMFDDDGEPITSAVLVSTEYTPPKEDQPPRGKNQGIAITALKTILDNYPNGQWTYSDGGNRVSVKDWKSECEKSGMHRTRFYDVSKTLEDKGKVEVIGGYAALL